jgi:HrpA-like RNA helicase
MSTLKEKSKSNSKQAKSKSNSKQAKSKSNSKQVESKKNSKPESKSTKKNSVKQNYENRGRPRNFHLEVEDPEKLVFPEFTKMSESKLLEPIGILDPKGVQPNPLTNAEYQNIYENEEIEGGGVKVPMTYANASELFWNHLAVYQKREIILKAINNHQILLAKSGTGSGKTVIMPKLIMHQLGYGKRVLCAIPKKSSARGAAEFAAKCLDVKLGEQVGYYFKGDRAIDQNGVKTILSYTTTGSLTSRIKGNDRYLKDYDAIVIDEAHERSVQMDFLFLLLKSIVEKRKDIRIIIMSATMDFEKFRNFYPQPAFNFGEIDVGSGTTHPITEHWLARELKPREWEKETIKTIIDILKTSEAGDILVFVKSGGDGRRLCDTLKTEIKRNKLENINPFCTELESKSRNIIESDGQNREKFALEQYLYMNHPEMNKDNPFTRKIVMATNVAESSLTVQGIVYVIETGLELMDKYYPSEMARSLSDAFIAKSAVTQRKGRAGRTRPGICYHLYTKKQFEKFPDYPIPDIQKTDLSDEFLDLLGMPDIHTLGDLNKFLDTLIDPPEDAFRQAGIRTLYGLGAITGTANDDTITELGLAMAKFRGLKPQYSKSLISAYYNGCRDDVLAIIMILLKIDGRIDGLFQRFRPSRPPVKITKGKDGTDIIIRETDKDKDRRFKREEREYEKIKQSFYHKYGDHLTILNVYHAYQAKKEEPEITNSMVKAWCVEHWLNMKTFDYVKKQSRRVLQTLRDVTRRGYFEEHPKIRYIKRTFETTSQLDNDKSGISFGFERPKRLREYVVIANELVESVSKEKKTFTTNERVLIALLDGNCTNLALQKKNGTYYSCFPPRKTDANLSRETTIRTYGKICMYDELFIQNTVRKLNVVSKFSNAIIHAFTPKIREVFKKCRNHKVYADKKQEQMKKEKLQAQQKREKAQRDIKLNRQKAKQLLHQQKMKKQQDARAKKKQQKQQNQQKNQQQNQQQNQNKQTKKNKNKKKRKNKNKQTKKN